MSWLADSIWGKKQWCAVVAIGSRGFKPWRIRPKAPGLWAYAVGPFDSEGEAQECCDELNALSGDEPRAQEN